MTFVLGVLFRLSVLHMGFRVETTFAIAAGLEIRLAFDLENFYFSN